MTGASFYAVRPKEKQQAALPLLCSSADLPLLPGSPWLEDLHCRVHLHSTAQEVDRDHQLCVLAFEMHWREQVLNSACTVVLLHKVSLTLGPCRRHRTAVRRQPGQGRSLFLFFLPASLARRQVRSVVSLQLLGQRLPNNHAPLKICAAGC